MARGDVYVTSFAGIVASTFGDRSSYQQDPARSVGDALRSRTEGRQTTEVAIAVASLNRMLKLGRPEYVRLK